MKGNTGSAISEKWKTSVHLEGLKFKKTQTKGTSYYFFPGFTFSLTKNKTRWFQWNKKFVYSAPRSPASCDFPLELLLQPVPLAARLIMWLGDQLGLASWRLTFSTNAWSKQSAGPAALCQRVVCEVLTGDGCRCLYECDSKIWACLCLVNSWHPLRGH